MNLRIFIYFLSVNLSLYSGTYKDLIELTQTIPEGTEKTFEFSEIRSCHNVLLDMINNSKKSIEIGMFYFENKENEAINDIIKSLVKISKNVQIKIISDMSFYKKNPETINELSKNKNFFIRLIDMKKISNGVMHAKYMIIDEEEIFLGSNNFDWAAFKHVHEFGIRIRNKDLAKTIKAIFEVDWNLSIPLKIKSEKNQLQNKKQIIYSKQKISRRNLLNSVNKSHPINVKLNNEQITIYPAFSPAFLSYKNVEKEETIITQLMANAKKSIFVQVMEFSPVTYEKKLYPILENAIKQASLNGVNIKMIFSDWTIKYPGFNFVKALSTIDNINIKISTIPPLDPCLPFSRVEHCKYMLVDDDILFISTGNWEYSYFYNCRNIGVCIKSKQLNNIAKTIFTKDWEGPYTQYINPLKKYQTPDFACMHTKNEEGKDKISITKVKPLTSYLIE